MLDVRVLFTGSAPASGAVADALVGNSGKARKVTHIEKQPARTQTATSGAAVVPNRFILAGADA